MWDERGVELSGGRGEREGGGGGGWGGRVA